MVGKQMKTFTIRPISSKNDLFHPGITIFADFVEVKDDMFYIRDKNGDLIAGFLADYYEVSIFLVHEDATGLHGQDVAVYAHA